MTDQELKNRLVAGPDDAPVVELVVEENPASQLLNEAIHVMASYQNANKWLDSIKEELLMTHNSIFFSNYIHELAHSMPARFDKFGDILHTMDMKVPYPDTVSIPFDISNMNAILEVVFRILTEIIIALREFTKKAEENNPAASISAEELLLDINNEFTNLYRMKRAYHLCEGDMIKFDKWVELYLSKIDLLID